MKDQLISFETAKLAKEKGFDSKYTEDYDTLGVVQQRGMLETYNLERISAPTQSLLQKWLREVHEIYVSALPFRDIEYNAQLGFYYTLVETSDTVEEILCNEIHLGASDITYDSYEQALETGLLESLKLIKT